MWKFTLLIGCAERVMMSSVEFRDKHLLVECGRFWAVYSPAP
ncbi:MAG: hypothetical protein OSJ74_08360 [Clostridia bacterium]|nr:hypothetical protein [Clostridia bacterium]